MPAMTRARLLALALILVVLAPIAMPPSASAAQTHAKRTRFHFDDIPVRSALQLLAEEGGVNLVVSDSVTGNVSLHLEDVTWEQALAVVVRLKGLDLRVVGDSRVVAIR
jgi:type IV pilus assembly protein PilQ